MFGKVPRSAHPHALSDTRNHENAIGPVLLRASPASAGIQFFLSLQRSIPVLPTPPRCFVFPSHRFAALRKPTPALPIWEIAGVSMRGARYIPILIAMPSLLQWNFLNILIRQQILCKSGQLAGGTKVLLGASRVAGRSTIKFRIVFPGASIIQNCIIRDGTELHTAGITRAASLNILFNIAYSFMQY